MLTTAQCQKPVTVGASGSHIVTTKLCVPDGKPLQESCGETSWPLAPKMPLTCGIASFSPSFRSLLVSENVAAGGRLSYGFQLIWLLLFLKAYGLESDCCLGLRSVERFVLGRRVSPRDSCRRALLNDPGRERGVRSSI